MFLILTLLRATDVVPVRRRRKEAARSQNVFIGKGGIFHSLVYLSCEMVDSKDTSRENKRQNRTWF